MKTSPQIFLQKNHLNSKLIDFFFIAVDDASGHYTTGYFWGNNYWTGSLQLCRSIYATNRDTKIGNKIIEFL